MEVPLYRSRSERFDDLVLLAVSQLEPRWEAELSGVEFAVEEIPPADLASDDPGPVPLARADSAVHLADACVLGQWRMASHDTSGAREMVHDLRAGGNYCTL